MHDNMSIQKRRRRIMPEDESCVMETIMNDIMKGGPGIEDNADIMPSIYDGDERMGAYDQSL